MFSTLFSFYHSLSVGEKIDFWILAVLVIHAGLFWWQGRTLKKSVVDAANKEARELRAYVSTTDIKRAINRPGSTRREFLVEIELFNTGRTPARKIKAVAGLKWNEGSINPVDPIFTESTNSDIGGGEKRLITLTFILAKDEGIGDNSLNTIEGMVHYQDIFGNNWETPLSYIVEFANRAADNSWSMKWKVSDKNPT